MVIKILGTGCSKCTNLFNNVKSVVEKHSLNAEVIKLEDFNEIMKYNVMSTPALVVDEKVVSKGRVLNEKNIEKILNCL